MVGSWLALISLVPTSVAYPLATVGTTDGRRHRVTALLGLSAHLRGDLFSETARTPFDGQVILGQAGVRVSGWHTTSVGNADAEVQRTSCRLLHGGSPSISSNSQNAGHLGKL